MIFSKSKLFYYTIKIWRLGYPDMKKIAFGIVLLIVICVVVVAFSKTNHPNRVAINTISVNNENVNVKGDLTDSATGVFDNSNRAT
ncbi:hypothetical protein H5P36_11705 [Bacillus sp. APMAM]|nr:hypothetical protein [Bacillus sp. APMAM]RTZ55840.1 hypothetical protein EKO25_10950 [Bacillus sp. SAJ1]